MTNKSLVDKLLQASQKIQRSSLRGSGNYIVSNPNVFTATYRIAKIKRIFESLNDRIYTKEFERVFKSDVRKLIRKKKINKLFND
jgi:hypothetical protein